MRKPVTAALRRRWRLLAAVAVVLVAVGAWYWWLWASTHGPDFGFAVDRDAALHAAERHIAALNTVDPATADKDLATWLNATTGPLHEELTKTQEADRKKILARSTTADGKIGAAAVTSLDPRAGTATVIASVNVTVTKARASPVVQHKRFQAQLTRTQAGAWKVKSLTALGVGSI